MKLNSPSVISAVVVAMDHIVKGTQWVPQQQFFTFCNLLSSFRGKRGFASKRIILFSNLCGEFGDDHIDNICDSLKNQDIELDVMYVQIVHGFVYFA
jgi:ATP-dependent DNA helicase 2 subunit 2